MPHNTENMTVDDVEKETNSQILDYLLYHENPEIVEAAMRNENTSSYSILDWQEETKYDSLVQERLYTIANKCLRWKREKEKSLEPDDTPF